jgi:hypothetical protein
LYKFEWKHDYGVQILAPIKYIYIKYFIYQIHYFDWLKIIDYIIIIKVHIYEEREKLNVGIIATTKLYVTLHIYLLLLSLYNQLFLTNQNNVFDI